MRELKLGREYYHRLRDMEQWLDANIGSGDWAALSDFLDDNNLRWSINQMFGYTYVRFRRDSDATMFTLRWL
jgi:hypothetical protein